MCQFLLYSKVIQLYIYVYIHFYCFIMTYHRILNMVLCAI